MKDAVCKNCVYFRQHYVISDDRLFRVFCGHCVKEKVRSKKPDAKACDHFLAGAPEEEAFATKQYLSKRLLEYILSMDLLPEIGDAAAFHGSGMDIR